MALMHEPSERGPDWARLPADWPQLPSQRRSLGQVVAERRAARRPISAEGLRRWQAEYAWVADQLARRQRAGAVAERRVAEALRAWPPPAPSRRAAAAAGAAGRRARPTGGQRSAAAGGRTADQAPKRRVGPRSLPGPTAVGHGRIVIAQPARRAVRHALPRADSERKVTHIGAGVTGES
jgi:hypothetical protein